jgi:hypothetical protein
MAKVFIIGNSTFGYKELFDLNKSLDESGKYYFDYLIPFIKKYKKENDCLIHLGNVFNRNENINVKTINQAVSVFERLSELLPVFILLSKHDTYGTLNVLTVLKNIKNVYIVDKSATLYDNKIQLYGYHKDIIEEIKNKNIFLNHFNKILEPVENLEHYSESEFLFVNNEIYGLNLNIDFKIIYSGVKDETKGNNKCIESPYPLNFNSKNNGIWVLDVESGQEKFIPNGINSKFEIKNITSIGDLKILTEEYLNNNFVDLNINFELSENLEFQMKLSQLNVKSIHYTKQDIIEEQFEEEKTYDIFDLDAIITDNINSDTVKNEFDNVKRIYSK